MLTFVPTPIGNLGDITQRALDTLREADCIAAEDTRHTGILLQKFSIEKPLLSYHEHNEAVRTPEIASRLEAGENIALVTDAGMPSLSDPGFRLISACVERGIPFTVLPGPSSITTALVGSGFPCDRFYFGGFLPPKSGRRENEIKACAGRSETSIYFESPHRIIRTLEAMVQHLPHRRICVARELSKKFEEYVRGTPAEVLQHFTAKPPKGEICVLVAGLSKREAREHAEDSEE
ncbi:MAG: 16S rRNA (cytidine(1402)-2'-O)-methyltransferase [Chthoniobacterales bacterium]